MSVQNSDFIFNYTSSQFGGGSSNSSLSLGGYPSQYLVNLSQFFDNNIGKNLEQYRCISITNSNQTSTASGLYVYIKKNSLNPFSSISIAVEIPSSDFTLGSATAATIPTAANLLIASSVTDSSNLNFNGTNAYIGASMTFTSGLNNGVTRIISSYNYSLNTVYFSDPFPNPIQIGDAYYVHPTPSSSIASATESPNFGSSNISSLENVYSPENPIYINVNENREHGNNMEPNDVVYLWIKRSLMKNSPIFDNNSMTINLGYIS